MTFMFLIGVIFETKETFVFICTYHDFIFENGT